MKRFYLSLIAIFLGGCLLAQEYVPTPENIRAREEFSSHRLGIFLHWGIYSMYAQGEWYLSTNNLDREAYSAAAGGFCPSRFDPEAWAKAFKESGAGYVTMTSRHHDGFSMFRTAQSPFNIVDGTPFRRDALGELTAAVKAEGMDMHFYYSLLDWIRDDYPKGGSGVAKDASLADYDHYFEFEKAQIRELMEQYHPSAFWFDGMWDHDGEPDFPWRMEELYGFIHSIDDSCLIGNNHHRAVMTGEDFQMFEKDLPGENTAGFSGGQQVSETVPLEMCETMNWAWGYRVEDQAYKSVRELVHLLVRAASKGSNLLINIGPQADGSLPAPALDRLRGLGEWMKVYSLTVDGTAASGIEEQVWGVTTAAPGRVYCHILKPETLPAAGGEAVLVLPLNGRVASVRNFATGASLPWKADPAGFVTVTLPAPSSDAIDTVVEIDLRTK